MKRILAIVLVSASPILALAQAYSPNQGVSGLFNFASITLNRAMYFIIALAVVYFIWQVFRYAVAGDEESKGKAKTQMIWGIVGIFVMVSVWGLVAILQATFGTSAVTGSIGNQLPQI